MQRTRKKEGEKCLLNLLGFFILLGRSNEKKQNEFDGLFAEENSTYAW